jgi:hypothetical protein
MSAQLAGRTIVYDNGPNMLFRAMKRRVTREIFQDAPEDKRTLRGGVFWPDGAMNLQQAGTGTKR